MRQVFILTVGYPGSGKSQLVSQIQRRYPNLSVINGDPLRDLLKRNVAAFKDLEFSKPSELVTKVNKLVKDYKRGLVKLVLGNGDSVLLEGNHLQRKDRDLWLDTAKDSGIKTIIIYLKVPEAELMRRYKEREIQVPNSSWVSEFEDWRKSQLEEPDTDEANEVIVYDQKNLDQVFMQFEGILG